MAATSETATAPRRTPDLSPDASAPLVVPFADGHREQNDLLGGKGANLAEMTRLGLPIPAGFVEIGRAHV